MQYSFASINEYVYNYGRRSPTHKVRLGCIP